MPDEKYAACVLAIPLRYPARLALRIAMFDVIRDYARDQTFEFFIPAVLICVHRTMSSDHPAQVAGTRWSDDECGCFDRDVGRRIMRPNRKRRLHCPERIDHQTLLVVAERCEQCRDVGLRALFEIRGYAASL